MTITDTSQPTVFPITDCVDFKRRATHWAAQRDAVCCVLDNNGYTEGGLLPEFECLVAVGVARELVMSEGKNAFEALQNFHDAAPDWTFGFLNYDLKNDLETLESANFDGLDFPELHFFQPKILLKITAAQLVVLKNEEAFLWLNSTIFHQIQAQKLPKHPLPIFDEKQPIPHLQPRISKAEYLKTVEKIKNHIHRGDLYEMNFCQEFFADNAHLDTPVALFSELNDLAQTPFAAYYQLDDKTVCCASPERFLKKTGQQLVSQPIKGTSKRGDTEGVDFTLKTTLQNDPKNRSENVMIVDLVRNDLGKVCRAGSVRVRELFGVYTFPTVHQLISTIEGELQSELSFSDAFKATFPMGSMTGAPKIRAMQLAEQYEKTRRGLYSGAIGYITPTGDFDFNVVIRSILYNTTNRYLSFQVGGAIVADSDPEAEYAECLLKAQNLFRILKK